MTVYIILNLTNFIILMDTTIFYSSKTFEVIIKIATTLCLLLLATLYVKSIWIRCRVEVFGREQKISFFFGRVPHLFSIYPRTICSAVIVCKCVYNELAIIIVLFYRVRNHSDHIRLSETLTVMKSTAKKIR